MQDERALKRAPTRCAPRIHSSRAGRAAPTVSSAASMVSNPISSGRLYIVATPIGNLDDFSARAQSVLAQADTIAAEDTRHSATLLQRFAINTPMVSLHEHNETERVEQVLVWLRAGQTVALISDAGTPLISDPGYELVRCARAAGMEVVAVPGPCAAIAALSVAGLPTDRFVFEGFLPPRGAARRRRLQTLRDEPRTLVFYESAHRVEQSLTDMAGVLGAEREAVLARELTKKFETVLQGSLEELARRVHEDARQRKGELVVVVRGAPPAMAGAHELDRLLALLIEELPLSRAAAVAARWSGAPKREVYARAERLRAQAKACR